METMYKSVLSFLLPYSCPFPSSGFPLLHYLLLCLRFSFLSTLFITSSCLCFKLLSALFTSSSYYHRLFLSFTFSRTKSVWENTVITAKNQSQDYYRFILWRVWGRHFHGNVITVSCCVGIAEPTNAFPQKWKARWVTTYETRRFRSNGLPNTWDWTLESGVPYPVRRRPS
jgi:hypothetical protein